MKFIPCIGGDSLILLKIEEIKSICYVKEFVLCDVE